MAGTVACKQYLSSAHKERRHNDLCNRGQIADWPDFKNRGLPVWPLPGSFDDFKKYVDWAFRYKFNRIYTQRREPKAADGFNLPTSKSVSI